MSTEKLDQLWANVGPEFETTVKQMFGEVPHNFHVFNVLGTDQRIYCFGVLFIPESELESITEALRPEMERLAALASHSAKLSS